MGPRPTRPPPPNRATPLAPHRRPECFAASRAFSPPTIDTSCCGVQGVAAMAGRHYGNLGPVASLAASGGPAGGPSPRPRLQLKIQIPQDCFTDDSQGCGGMRTLGGPIMPLPGPASLLGHAPVETHYGGGHWGGQDVHAAAYHYQQPGYL